jgi:lipid II:glycine glycyltransferase (peptidoglycan interpeptide bridge formation enzyme)
MITRVLTKIDQEKYNKLIIHPIQTWEWGDFQESQGHKVYRLASFDKEKLVSAYSVSFHKIPKTNYSIGTILRGPTIDRQMIEVVTKLARDENAIFVKFEPNEIHKTFNLKTNTFEIINKLPDFPHLLLSPKNAFYPHSFILDISKTEDELLASMHPKTRYNIRIANRHDVKIFEKTDDQGFESYLKIIFETTKRQGFYLHTPKYHYDQWKLLKNTGMIHLVFAEFKGKIVASFMLLKTKDHFYYPYGGSLDIYKEVMAPTLLMWESIKLGKNLGCKTFDMWGSLGPNALESEQGYGFHRFKQGYGGQLVQFVGTYDLVINHNLYQLYNLADKIRWKLLRLKATIKKG